MADTYFLHDNTGKCIGTIYDNNPPARLEPGISYVKLSYEQINQMNYDFRRYRYKDNSFIKQPEVIFCVTPSNLYEIGTHNKISICIKSDYDTTNEEKEQLIRTPFRIKINEVEYGVTFEEIVMLDPEEVGVYVIELLNDNVICDVPRYAISVVDTQEP